MNNKNYISVSVKIIDKDGDHFLGNGIVWLLENIKETGSISQAAVKMNMSYSKAWKIIKKLEMNTCQKVISSFKGGQKKGGALLTDEGIKFISDFHKLDNSIKEFANKKFKKFNF